MTDGRDHRHRAARDRAHDALVIERRQIGGRATTATDDHEIDAGADDHRHAHHDLVRRRRSLHRAVGDQDRRREPAVDGADDVVHRGAARRGHHADALREPGQRALLRLGEDALGRELHLELLAGESLGARSRRLCEIGVELHLAVALVDAEPAANAQVEPGDDLELETLRVTPPHHRREHGPAVREREVEVPGARPRGLGDLALDPDQPERVERPTGEPDDLGDPHRPRATRSSLGRALAGGHDAP